MGPRLGPLIVTSVLTRIHEDRASTAARLATGKPRGALAERIGDSKKLVAFADRGLGEAWARALVVRDGGAPATPAELLEALSLDPEEVLRRPCPDEGHLDLCWSGSGESFASTDAMVAECVRDIDRLVAKGLSVVRARVAIVCTRRLNDAVTAGLSRFDVDLHTMERLTLAARQDAGADVYALCGKVGGFDFYADRFGPLAGRLHTMLVEGRARSEYAMPGVGRLAFVRDADESHLIVGLASLVGKWARDYLMRKIVRWHQVHDPALPDVSGYHDPATTKFIAASSLLRKKHKVQSGCFERTALGRLGPTSSVQQQKSTPRARSKAQPSPRP